MMARRLRAPLAAACDRRLRPPGLAPCAPRAGVGGTPEGVIAAAALKCMGGHIEGEWSRGTAQMVVIPGRR